MSEKSTHCLVPYAMAEAVRAHCESNNLLQSEWLRDAVWLVLREWMDAAGLPAWPKMPRGPSVSVVMRLPDEYLADLKALAERTHVIQSHWIRYAILSAMQRDGIVAHQQGNTTQQPEAVR